MKPRIKWTMMNSMRVRRKNFSSFFLIRNLFTIFFFVREQILEFPKSNIEYVILTEKNLLILSTKYIVPSAFISLER